jgi:hypothetical protein
MHNTLQRINNKLKKFERKSLTDDQRQVVAAIKEILNVFQVKQTKGLAFTGDDLSVLGAMEIIVDYMVKDSSIT